MVNSGGWDVADNISEKDDREITIDDIATFVAKTARAAAHPIFGSLTGDSKEEKRGNDQNSSRWKHGDSPRNNFANWHQPKSTVSPFSPQTKR